MIRAAYAFIAGVLVPERGDEMAAASNKQLLAVTGLSCKHCGDVIFSRARHDMRGCTCGKVCIDGGFDYIKVSGFPQDMEFVELKIPATKEALYLDWRTGKDKFGLVKGIVCPK